MADYYTSPYGTKVSIKGLTPEQVKKVKQLADTRYGTKAAALSATFQK